MHLGQRGEFKMFMLIILSVQLDYRLCHLSLGTSDKPGIYHPLQGCCMVLAFSRQLFEV
jgi:hypothetical protein